MRRINALTVYFLFTDKLHELREHDDDLYNIDIWINPRYGGRGLCMDYAYIQEYQRVIRKYPNHFFTPEETKAIVDEYVGFYPELEKYAGEFSDYVSSGLEEKVARIQESHLYRSKLHLQHYMYEGFRGYD